MNRRDFLKLGAALGATLGMATPLIASPTPNPREQLYGKQPPDITPFEDIFPTGFPTIDKALNGGLRPGLIIISGPAGSGKSAVLRRILETSLSYGTECAYLSESTFAFGNFTEFAAVKLSRNSEEPKVRLAEKDVFALGWTDWSRIVYRLPQKGWYGDIAKILDKAHQDDVVWPPLSRIQKAHKALRMLYYLTIEHNCCIILTHQTRRRINLETFPATTYGQSRYTMPCLYRFIATAVFEVEKELIESDHARLYLTKNRFGLLPKYNPRIAFRPGGCLWEDRAIATEVI